MTELSMIMNWCTTHSATLEIMLVNGKNDDFYNTRVTILIEDYKAVFVFKSSLKGIIDNKAVYRLYENKKAKTTHVFDDFGIDLLEIVYDTIYSTTNDFLDFVDDFGDFAE